MSSILKLGKSIWHSPGEYLTKLDTSISLVKFASSIIRSQPSVSTWAFNDKMSVQWLSCPLEIASCCLKTALVINKTFIQIDKDEPDHSKARNKKILSTLALVALSLLPYTLFAFTKKFSAPATNLLQTTFSSLNNNPTLKGRLSISWESPAIHKIKQCLSLHQFFLSTALLIFSKKDSDIEKIWLAADLVLRLAQTLILYSTPWIKLKHHLPDSAIDILIPGTSPEKGALRSSKLFPLVRHYYVPTKISRLIDRYSLQDFLVNIPLADNWITKRIQELHKLHQEAIINTITPLINSLIGKATNIETELQRQLQLPPRILTCASAILAPLKLLTAAE